MNSLIKNILAYPSAFGYVLKNGLGKYFILSGLLSLGIGLALFGGAYYLSDDVGGLLTNLYPWERGSGLIASISTYFSGALLTIVGLLLYKYILLIVISPFMSPLSEAVEEIETGVPPRSQGLGQMGYSIVRGIRISIRNISKEIFYTIILLIIGLFPLFSLFSTVMLFLVQAYYIGFANTDYHLEKSFSVRESIKYCKAHRMAILGNGIGYLLLLLLPIVGLIIAPVLGTVVATRNALQTDY